MKVAAGEAKTAASIVSFYRPSHVLRFFSLDRGTNEWIAAVGTVRARERFGRRQRGEDRRHALHPIAKSHVVIPFVFDLERLDASGDRMLGKAGEIGRPDRVDRPVSFKVAADPIQEFLAGG